MFSLNDLKERLHEEEFVYFVNENTKEVFEYTLEQLGNPDAMVLSDEVKMYDEFPYEAYGYEDPYNFANDYTVYTTGGTITYEVDKNGKVQEVCHGIA